MNPLDYLQDEVQREMNLTFLQESEDDIFDFEEIYGVPNQEHQDLSDKLYKQYDLPDLSPVHSHVFGREVGDDRVDLSYDPNALVNALVVQEQVFMMKTSWEDTFITKSLWNFCEVTNELPCSPYESFEHARKTGNLDNLGFTDAPPLRIVVDTFKGDKSHSSSIVGKSSMLGNRLNTPRTEHKLTLQLASFMQDGMLRIARSPDPKYIPYTAGGCNSKGLFEDPLNVYLSVKSYRGGGYDRLYGTAVNEIRTCLDAMEMGQHKALVLCKKLRDKQEYLHGTYAEKVLIDHRDPITGLAVENPPVALYKATGGSNVFSAVENRLFRTKVTLGETDAVREILRNSRIHESLFGISEDINTGNLRQSSKKMGMRSEYEYSLQANTAFQNLLKRTANTGDVSKLIKEGFLEVGCGVREFTQEQAIWLSNGGRTKNYSIIDLTSSEAVYIRSEVTDDATLKVGGITLKPVFSGVQKTVVTRASVGLYQINDTQLEWANRMVSELKQIRDQVGRPLRPNEALSVFIKDREWVNDDTLLINKCLQLTGDALPYTSSVVLVSDDKRLGNQMSETCNVKVMRIRPVRFLERYSGPLPITSRTDLSVELLRSMGILTDQEAMEPIVAVFLDTGSIASASAKHQFERDRKCRTGIHMYRRDIVNSYQDESNGRRTCEYILRELSTHKGTSIVHHHRPVYSQPGKRRFGGLFSRGSTTSSTGSASVNWRSNSDAG